MITWIIFGYLAVSTVATLLVYSACIVSAHADRVQERAFTVHTSQEHQLSELMRDDKRAERLASARLLLNA